MKKLFKVISYFALVLVNVNLLSSQPTWVWQNPYPNAHSIRANYFFDANTGYVSGDYGSIMKTTDGGINWTVYYTGGKDEITGIVFVNSLTGFASGGYDPSSTSSKKIYKTTNGGLNWVSTNLGPSYSLNAVDFVNSNLGITVSSYQTIHYTTNGGTNWNTVNGAVLGNYCVDFVTPTLAFVGSSSGTIQRTSNGGVNWTSSVVAGSNSVTSISFVDSLTGYLICPSNVVLKTTNSGANWFSVAPTNFSYNHNSVFFQNANTGMIAGESGKILITTNGGTNWTLSMPYFYNFPAYYTCSIISPNVFYVFGENGSKIKSTNAGVVWNNLMPTKNSGIFSSFFLDANTGWASENGSILRTTNGGTNWISSQINISNNITGLNFINASTGFAIPAFNTNGEYLKTTDGGTNWSLTAIILNKSFWTIQFINQTTGFMTSTFELYKTTNSGNNWNMLDSSGFQITNSIFANSNTGYVTYFNLSNTYFKKTTNGGTNWTTLGGFIPNSYISILKSFGADTIYAFGGASFYKTVNGGLNWSNEILTGTTIQAAYFINQSSGFVGGVFGILKQTTDGGVNLYNVNSGTSDAIYTMYINGTQMWTMGTGSAILKSNDAITFASYEGTGLPADISLSQNYPNPFNPSTKIDFFIPKNSFVSLKIYNVLGEELETLISQNLSTGFHSYNYNATKLSSGIYFYKLSAGEFSMVKKMIILK